MIELPEAHVLATQLTDALSGRIIRWAQAGQTPHKFAFHWGDPAGYGTRMAGQAVGPASACGSRILVPVGQADTLMLGDGGERLRLHASPADLPQRHQLAVVFADGRAFSVTVQGWGMVRLVPNDELPRAQDGSDRKPSPLGDDFTPEWLIAQAEEVRGTPRMSVKEFLAAGQRIPGLGNGCLQDILLDAGMDPRRKVADCTREELIALHGCVVSVLRQMTAQGGRDTETDLYGNPGGYRKRLDARSVGTPCPHCGEPIVKIAYMGGACYLCPHCQR